VVLEQAARSLLAGPPRVVNVGLEQFGDELRRQEAAVVQVDWRPPAGGDPRLVELLARVTPARDREGEGQASVGVRVDDANRIAVRRLLDSRPMLVDVQPAGDALPGMAPNLVLHAGPPIAWEAMCALQRGAVAVGAIYEGLARDAEEAGRLVARGAIRLGPCHAHGAVGPMTGIITASMPVLVIENRGAGNRAHATINEGMGKVLRFGATQPEVIERLRWMRDDLAPALRIGLRATDHLLARPRRDAPAVHVVAVLLGQVVAVPVPGGVPDQVRVARADRRVRRMLRAAI